jgi:hypothetical protein
MLTRKEHDKQARGTVKEQEEDGETGEKERGRKEKLRTESAVVTSIVGG